MSKSEFSWPVCPDCGGSSAVMHDFVTQRFDVGQRVQFKFTLGECYLCSDVYHREREFLVFAAEQLYPTAHPPPVASEERLGLEDFLVFFQPGGGQTALDSYQMCFRQAAANKAPERSPSVSYLSSFPASALSLVTKDRVLRSLRELPPRERAIVLLYLMGARSYRSLAQFTACPEAEARELLFTGRRALQDLVCSC